MVDVYLGWTSPQNVFRKSTFWQLSLIKTNKNVFIGGLN